MSGDLGEKAALRRVIDRLAIEDVIHGWCRAVDRRDWDALRSVFHPDGTDSHGLYSGGVDGLVAWLKERHIHIVSSLHVASNVLIEFVNDDKALVETYVTACQRYAPEGAVALAAISGTQASGNPVDMLMFGRYVDIFECRNQAWKIRQRTTVFDNSMMFEVPSHGAKLSSAWTLGRRDADDPVFEKRREMGLA